MHYSTGSSQRPDPAVCWACGSTDTFPWKGRTLKRSLTPEDLRITDSNYGATLALSRCRQCGLIFALSDELPHLERLYSQLDDPGYEQSQEPRRLQMRSLLRTTRKLFPSARTALDIGAGTGLLVAEATTQGLEAIGIEPSLSLVQAAQKLNHVELLHGVFPHPQLPRTGFDLVFLVDVIEHVVDPAQLLSNCKRVLNSNGLIVLVTPDAHSMAARLLKRLWWHFRLAHVSYFSARSMERLAERTGLAITHQRRPTWYFTVRYLAERAAKYLPLGGMNRMAERVSLLRAVFRWTIPLNLHDSWIFFLRQG